MHCFHNGEEHNNKSIVVLHEFDLFRRELRSVLFLAGHTIKFAVTPHSGTLDPLFNTC